MKHSENLDQISKALAAAQGEMKPALKESTNPHFKSKFADFTSIWQAIREPMSKHGLCVLQDVTTVDGSNSVSVTTKIIHSSGQWIECGPLNIPLARKDAQGIGAATTYAKRYSLCAAVGVVDDEDDDGNMISGSRNGNHEKPIVAEIPNISLIDQSSLRELNAFIEASKDREVLLQRILDGCKVTSLDKIPAVKVPAILNWVKEGQQKAV